MLLLGLSANALEEAGYWAVQPIFLLRVEKSKTQVICDNSCLNFMLFV